MGKKTGFSVVFLWHMHQPPYEDASTGEMVLPWVYLHGTKDYYDMADTVRRVPGVKVVMNLTPALLLQLEDYAEGRVRDRTLDMLCSDPRGLGVDERRSLLELCTRTCGPAVANAFPRYRQLRDLFKASTTPDAAAEAFTDEELVDLTTLFLLGWCGPSLSREPRVAALAEKGGDYEPGDRRMLVELGTGFIRGIVPLYKELADEGRVELSTSPFYHPLSPLLVSNAAAREADAGIVLPGARLDAPDELARQLDLGMARFVRSMGVKPRGVWPPEGAVSEAVVRLFEEKGVRWTASDEEILRRSLGGWSDPADRLAHYRFAGVDMFFRDRILSDHIGFVYSRWPNERSVAHFMGTVQSYAERRPGGVTLVALDGENAWEFYPDGGYPFIEALYRALAESSSVATTTPSEYLDTHGPGDELDVLATGSWIEGNLNTWIGDPVKNRAWEYLAAAYQTVRDIPGAKCRHGARAGDEADERCCLLRAEASDWFWWFGEGHDSIHDREFDYLFRQNLKAAYRDVGLAAPEHLDRPLAGAGGPVSGAVPPSSMISPKINGRIDSYYKWTGAGRLDFSHGAIHRLDPVISSLRYGYDRTALYLRLDGFRSIGDELAGDGWLGVNFVSPLDAQVRVTRDGSGGFEVTVSRTPGGPREELPGAIVAFDEVFEAALPVEPLIEGGRVTPPFAFRFYIVLGKGGLDRERFPWDDVVEVEFDPDEFEADNWFV